MRNNIIPLPAGGAGPRNSFVDTGIDRQIQTRRNRQSPPNHQICHFWHLLMFGNPHQISPGVAIYHLTQPLAPLKALISQSYHQLEAVIKPPHLNPWTPPIQRLQPRSLLEAVNKAQLLHRCPKVEKPHPF